jgi:hypothetical protein
MPARKKASPKTIVKAGVKKTHSIARRAKDVGTAIENVGHVVAAGAAAADSFVSEIERSGRARKRKA